MTCSDFFQNVQVISGIFVNNAIQGNQIGRIGMNILASWKTENERFEGISSSPVNMATDSKYLKSGLVRSTNEIA